MASGSRKHDLAELAELGGQLGRQLHSRISQWLDPRARLLRKRKRTARATMVWGGLTGLGGVGVGVEAAAGHLATFGGTGLLGATVLLGAGTVALGVRTLRLYRTPLPESAPAASALPPSGSVAREPMRRLATAEKTLHELLTQIAVPGETVADARATAVEAAAALRGAAAQVIAVERARDIAPRSECAALQDGIDRLRVQLDEGLDGYGALVAAAGHAVVASSSASPREALVDATDRLAGLASALRELSGGAA